MTSSARYPIGTPGRPWGEAEVAEWRSRQTRKRSYEEDVLSRIETLRKRFDVMQYGRLDYEPDTYPLFVLKSREWRDELPCVLVTGGVHGYETSGVHGALLFAERHAADYADRANLMIVPCVSPWGYERIHRWNPQALDPNRSFRADSPAPEAAALMKLVVPPRNRFILHIDLHETTDTDESEFRPALGRPRWRRVCAGHHPGRFLSVRRYRGHATRISAGGNRGGGEGHAHRAGRRERRDHRLAHDRARRHQLSAEGVGALRRHYCCALPHDHRGLSRQSAGDARAMQRSAGQLPPAPPSLSP